MPKLFFGIGVVLLVLGLFDLADAFLGSGRLGSGKLFFNREKVEEQLSVAIEASKPLAEACLKETVQERFDTASIKQLDALCRTVQALHEEPDAGTAVALLRADNNNFKVVADRLFSGGGEPAQISLDLMVARSQYRPALEKVGSQCAGASFSEFLLGIFFLVIGGLFLRYSRRTV
jgi:hypothetical protein